jgi:hypothetical protein
MAFFLSIRIAAVAALALARSTHDLNDPRRLVGTEQVPTFAERVALAVSMAGWLGCD